ncbi:sensor histidine kinase [Paenibacillus apiarius]|uniref:sensor histidine kinase n=1 Tax=Paenibacillus apiarius TaxID=46240 RepID=UPI00197D84FB|nr:sensor histidine kinase [Paenibacillus apiarius]MBN3523988.1 sensor histidine kinase [Paenibacillus apiarius]
MFKAFKQIYQKHFKKKLFNKLIAVYSFIAVASLLTVSVFAYQYFARNDINTALLEQQRTVDNMNRFLDQKYDMAQAITQQMFQDNMLIRDTVYLLEQGYEQYIRYRLDTYSSSNVFFTRNLQDFYVLQFWKDPDLQNISLISPAKQFALMYSAQALSGKMYDWSKDPGLNEQWRRERYGFQNPSYMSKKAKQEGTESTQGNRGQEPAKDMDGSRDMSLFTVTTRISSPETLLTAGHISIDFNAKGIARQIGSSIKGEQWLVLNQKGEIVYPAEAAYDGQVWPNYEKLASVDRNKSQAVDLEGQKSYVIVSKTNKLGLTVVGALPQAAITDHLSGIRNTIGIVTVLCIVTVLMLTYFSVLHLSRRTQTIVKAMKKVQDGNLNARLPVDREDELGLISESFNKMCEDLKQYINRFYKSELKQKHAELIALQAQIKPHFLFNTLEVIRMRAISQGVHDVGEMIYSLASMFRHMVKDKTVITVNEEIENCRRYLELTRIRYRDKLQYTINMDERLGGYNIMKLSVQPIIENYLVHGIGLERTDNHILIEVMQSEGKLVIRISDNGKGIEPERLKQIQQELNEAQIQDHGSLGLKNIQERLRILYGESYGLTIDSVLNLGTIVTIRVPLK